MLDKMLSQFLAKNTLHSILQNQLGVVTQGWPHLDLFPFVTFFLGKSRGRKSPEVYNFFCVFFNPYLISTTPVFMAVSLFVFYRSREC